MESIENMVRQAFLNKLFSGSIVPNYPPLSSPPRKRGGDQLPGYISPLSEGGTKGGAERDAIKYKKLNYHIIIIFAILLIFTLHYFHFLFSDNTIPGGDALNHSAFAARLYKSIRGDGAPFLVLIRDSKYPPVVFFTSCLLLLVFGFSPKITMIAQYVFAIILFLSLYGLGNYFGDRAGGLSALILGVVCQYFISFSHQYFLDLPVASLIILSLYLLIKSNGFGNLTYSILFGISTGIAFLTKYNSFVFIIPPMMLVVILYCFRSWKSAVITIISFLISGSLFFYYIYIGLKASKFPGRMPVNITVLILFVTVCVIFLLLSFIFRNKKDDDERQNPIPVLNMSISLFVMQLIAYPAYLISIQSFFIHFLGHKNHMKKYTLDFMGILLERLKIIAMSFPLAPIFIIVGIVFIFIIKKKYVEFGIIGISLLFGAGFTFFATEPDPRYVLPVVALSLVIGSYWIGSINRKFAVPVLIFMGIIFCNLYSIYFLSMPDYPMPFSRMKNFRRLLQILPDPIPLPTEDSYHLKEIMNVITTHHDQYQTIDEDNDIIYIMPNTTKKFEEYTRGKNLYVIRGDILDYSVQYYGKKGDRYHLMFAGDIAEATGEINSPIYLIVYYVDESEIEYIQEIILEKRGRDSRKLFSSSIPGNRKTGIVFIREID